MCPVFGPLIDRLLGFPLNEQIGLPGQSEPNLLALQNLNLF